MKRSLLIILITQLIKSNSTILNDDNAHIEPCIKFLNKYINTFPKVYFHYDNENRDIVDKILKSPENKYHIKLLNYDEEINLLRFIVKIRKAALQVVVLKDPLIVQQQIIQFQDDTIFVTRMDHSNDLEPKLFVRGPLLKISRSVKELRLLKDLAAVFKTCFSCSRENNFPLKVNITSDQDIPSALIAAENTGKHNLEGYTYKVLFTKWGSGFECMKFSEAQAEEDSESNECLELGGTKGMVLIELMKKFNFSVKLIQESNYVKIRNKLQTFEADWVINGYSIAGMTPERLDFSYSLNSDPIYFIYAYDKKDFTDFDHIIKPFTTETWIVLLISVTLMAIALRLIGKKKELFVMIWIPLKVLIDQPLIPSGMKRARHILVVWMLCAIVITTFYKTKMTSLSINENDSQLQNLEWLAQRNCPLLINQNQKILYKYLKTMQEDTLKKLSTNSRLHPDICLQYEEVFNGRAIMMDFSTEIFKSLPICTNNFRKHDIRKVGFTKANFAVTLSAWFFAKEHFMLPVVDEFYWNVSSTGLTNKWKRMSNPFGYIDISEFKKYQWENQKVLGFKNLIGPLILWTFGMTLSIVCFVLELVWKHRC